MSGLLREWLAKAEQDYHWRGGIIARENFPIMLVRIMVCARRTVDHLSKLTMQTRFRGTVWKTARYRSGFLHPKRTN